jgi:hypothetical protein
MQWRAYASGWEHTGKAPASDLLKVLLLGLLIGLPVAGMLLLAVYALYG